MESAHAKTATLASEILVEHVGKLSRDASIAFRPLSAPNATIL